MRIREIGEEEAKRIADEIYKAFSKNPNSATGGAGDLIKSHNKGIDVLKYYEEELMANKIIREKIITGFKSIAKHGKHFDLVNIDEQQITNELGKMIRFARSDINKMNSA